MKKLLARHRASQQRVSRRREREDDKSKSKRAPRLPQIAASGDNDISPEHAHTTSTHLCDFFNSYTYSFLRSIPMPTFDIYDTVVARTDRSLIGTVERTHISTEAYDLLDDYFILRHLLIPQPILTEFVTSGIPPRGFVFVSSLDEERGCFLASEDDLTLLCRSFDLGDIVKRDDGVTGNIVEVYDTYSIQPLWLVDGGITLASSLPVDHLKVCDPSKPDRCPHAIISSVPGPELTHKQTLFEDDLICYKEWLGVVQEVDVDVAVQFEDDSIVILDSPDDLYMPVPEPAVPLVSLPEFDENEIRRPDLPSAFQDHPWVIPTRFPRPCTFVVTSKSTLRSGRWVRGKYSSTCLNGGIVIDLIPRQMVAQWLSCNPFAALKARQVVPPAPTQNLYSNHSSYRSSSTLKQNANLAIIDLMSAPRSDNGRVIDSTSDLQSSGSSPEGKPPSLHQDLKVGDCVRFRDPSAAAFKYQGREHTSSGKFNRINEESTYGWDLNIFKVIAKEQNVQVMWQDGIQVSHNANELQRFGGFEPDFAPTDLVVNRAGLKQMRNDGSGPTSMLDFNEMTFFESPHSLHPKQVGVIQSVDARERVAKVRWFQQPIVTLLDNGNRLSADSRLGVIGNFIEEVSLYEVMTFPAFERRLRDVALLPPRNPSRRAMEIILSKSEAEAEHRQASLTLGLDPQRIFYAVRDVIRQRGFAKLATRAADLPVDGGSGIDWLGEIINTGLDGSLTVRLCGAKPCCDVKVSPDEILAVIHLDFVEADDAYSDHSMDEDEDLLDDFYDDDDSVETISETVEYEGGQRIDTDDDDEAWESAQEEGDDESKDEDIDMTDAEPTPPKVEVHHVPIPVPSSTETPSFATLQSHLPQAAPPPFDILSISPPPDQYQPPTPTTPSPSPTFLKRIRQEHKSLISGLPTSQIYVRTYESRLDLLRCLIIGPADTPYEHAPFLIDLFLPPTFPAIPPVAHFHSWTSGLGRINPNLYEEGKICLSLLGTWPGKSSDEGWSPKATILQVLVSLQGLVLVPRPFYNEAGFEGEIGYGNESAVYSERAFVMARGFVRFALGRPPVGVGDVLGWLYLPVASDGGFGKQVEREGLVERVLERGESLIEASEEVRRQSSGGVDADKHLMDGSGKTGDATKAFLRPLSKGAVVMLRRQLEELNGGLIKWKSGNTADPI